MMRSSLVLISQLHYEHLNVAPRDSSLLGVTVAFVDEDAFDWVEGRRLLFWLH
jgi:hypothetical protein